MLGNANAGLIAERKKAILMRMSPKLVELAKREAEGSLGGLIFGQNFITLLGKYVPTFTTLSKAQYNLRRVLSHVLLERLTGGDWLPAQEHEGPNSVPKISMVKAPYASYG